MSSIRYAAAAVLIACSMNASCSAAFTLVYNFDNETPNASNVVPGLTAAGFSRSDDAVVSYVNNKAGRAISSSGWTTGTDFTDYYAFSVTATVPGALDLGSLEFEERRSSTGVTRLQLQVDVGSGFQNVGASRIIPNNSSARDQSYDLSGFTGVSTAEFRIIGFSSEGGAGTWRLDDVTLSGSLSAIPEPSSLAFIGLSVIGLVCRRSRRA